MASPDPMRSATGASFNIEIRHAALPGLVKLVSNGCVGIDPGGAACGEDNSRPEARAQLHLTLGHLPALARMPAAALTVRGALRLGGAPWTLSPGHGGEASWSVQAGGEVEGDALVMEVAPGAPQTSALFDNHPALRARSPAALFLDLFRLDPVSWRGQPGVVQMDCAADCTASLVQRVAAQAEPARVWLKGGLHLDQPVTLGSVDRPVLLLVDGPVRITAPVTLHGLVYAFGPDWDGGPGLRIQGAVVAAGDLTGAGATRIEHDAEALRPFLQRAGTYAPVAGSWRDF